ncbi:MAG: tRNA (adenosine(37)-N6)-dimethylallyltransferase MiaA [Parachlamydiales bacterium]|nr:tRNA (adenosine(37)-N6)-dimethylallyltransferase MiaA [Parachlamydiales bacterium]
MAESLLQEEKSKLSINLHIPLEERIWNPAHQRKRKVIFIAGPTGTGKTELSLLLSKSLGQCQIISADSMQVYKGMDIGTAKVSSAIRQEIPHHLIDIRNIDESFNVVDFYYEARAAIESILALGHVPIVVGGAGFYYRSLLYGPPEGPPSVEATRLKIEAELEKYGAESLYERLVKLDPVYAETITRNDKHKIVRALEIIELTNKPVSAFSWKCRYPTQDFDFHCWFIYRPREMLYKILEDRCDEMIRMGFVDEVKTMKEKGLLLNPSASQAIGYKQCLSFLETAQTQKDLEEFIQKFKTASRHYAKKQFTWFRQEEAFRWLNVELHNLGTAAEMIMQDYHQGDLF